MADKKFTAKHSSVLRIMTKWAEYLTEIFDSAEKHVMMKLYQFKDIHNKLIDLDKIQYYLNQQILCKFDNFSYKQTLI